ncbi:MAG: alpha/beta hydrolase [Bacteroidota bacterium]|nr:lysophospholipase [Candidatus Kapabacteria bacterium]MDW8220837.1 alpha/beta hydrolase [Bacteroidota bacterium]
MKTYMCRKIVLMNAIGIAIAALVIGVEPIRAQAQRSKPASIKSAPSKPSNEIKATVPQKAQQPQQAYPTNLKADSTASIPSPARIAEPVPSHGNLSSVSSMPLLPRSPKRPSTPWKFTSEERALFTTTGSLWGTVLIPTNASTTASVPLLIIVNTSTVYDRNGISEHRRDSSNDARYLAEALAAEGIAVFRYDTRAVGRSIGAFVSEWYHDFDRTISDICGWIDSLRADKRFSTITIMGFSRPNDFGREASLAGIIAAWKKQVDGLILVAPESRRWLQYIRQQAFRVYPEHTARVVDSVAALLEQGVRPQLSNKSGIVYDLMRPSLQQYVLSLNKYNPVEEIAKLRIPIIVLHGTLDFSISDEHAKALVAANPRATYYAMHNMGMNLKNATQEASVAWSERSKIPVMPKLVDLLANFIYSVGQQP